MVEPNKMRSDKLDRTASGVVCRVAHAEPDKKVVLSFECRFPLSRIPIRTRTNSSRSSAPSVRRRPKFMADAASWFVTLQLAELIRFLHLTIQCPMVLG